MIEALTPQHDRSTFACGVEALDRYLRTQVSQDVAKRAAAAFVLCDAVPIAILGYYTLAATSLRLQALPPAVTKRLPKYPDIPATLLGRLAVDLRARGRGYGERLLLDALARSLTASHTIVSWAVVVDVKDEPARRFYERYDFLPLVKHPSRLFLPMRTIAALGIDPNRR
jgi:GNAT superfamily N-acetyltransferase